MAHVLLLNKTNALSSLLVPPGGRYHPQFVPKYLGQAKQRIKELSKELAKMPPTLTSNNELWDAYRKRVSQVMEWLKGMLAMRADRTICGNDPALNIIPHVDAMYHEYAKDILEVGAAFIINFVVV